MTTASQLIHSNKEVNVPLGLTEKKHVSSVVQVFQIGLIFISLCTEEAVQLSGLNLGSVQE